MEWDSNGMQQQWNGTAMEWYSNAMVVVQGRHWSYTAETGGALAYVALNSISALQSC